MIESLSRRGDSSPRYVCHFHGWFCRLRPEVNTLIRVELLRIWAVGGMI